MSETQLLFSHCQYKLLKRPNFSGTLDPLNQKEALHIRIYNGLAIKSQIVIILNIFSKISLHSKV